MVDYEKIEECLLSLLKLNDNDALPMGFGVCAEVADWTWDRGNFYPPPESKWVCERAEEFSGMIYVDRVGIMTPKRRDFIHYLLECISKETACVSKETAND